MNHGLGSDLHGVDVDPEDLGHFLTINVTFNADQVATTGQILSAVKRPEQ